MVRVIFYDLSYCPLSTMAQAFLAYQIFSRPSDTSHFLKLHINLEVYHVLKYVHEISNFKKLLKVKIIVQANTKNSKN